MKSEEIKPDSFLCLNHKNIKRQTFIGYNDIIGLYYSTQEESYEKASLEKKFGYYEAYSESSDGSYLYSWYNEDETVKFSIELSGNKILNLTFEVKSY